LARFAAIDVVVRFGHFQAGIEELVRVQIGEEAIQSRHELTSDLVRYAVVRLPELVEKESMGFAVGRRAVNVDAEQALTVTIVVVVQVAWQAGIDMHQSHIARARLADRAKLLVEGRKDRHLVSPVSVIRFYGSSTDSVNHYFHAEDG
jgi:hypothetical protein